MARFTALRLLCCGFLTALLAGGCNMAAQQANRSGVTMFQQGNYQKADEYFRQAIHNDPGNADSYYNLGANYQKLAKLTNQPIDAQQAESYYQQCLARNPQHADCYRGLAVLLAEQNRAPRRSPFCNAGRRSRRKAPSRTSRPRGSATSSATKPAQEALVYALRNEPNNPRALAAMGKLREDAGDYQQAIVNYQRALASNGYQPQLAQRVAMLQTRVDPNQQQYGPNGGRFAAQPTYPNPAPVQRY
ncbi:MAG: tetratricopeptide repeat protein [Pirellulales bacterium]